MTRDRAGQSDSERLSRRFYEALGPDGLARRTRPEWDAAIVAAVASELKSRCRVLDVGCGYGRVAVPLAARGLAVEGIDVSPRLIADAKRYATSERVAVVFRVGSMLELPYADGRFDAVLCLWSAFYELLDPDEQVAALREMSRVMAPDGLAIIEGPPYEPATRVEWALGDAVQSPDDRVARDVVAGLPNPHYRHDESSLLEACEAAGIDDARISIAQWAGRDRLFLRFSH